MLRPNRHIEKLPASVHGGIDYRETAALGLMPDDILDFSVNINPFGPPPGMEKMLHDAAIDRYPDTNSTELVTELAKYHNVSPESICVGAGTTELIRAVAAAYFSQQDTALIPQPTYGEYDLACRLTDAAIMQHPVAVEPDFKFDIREIKSLVKKRRPKGIFLCNPNNPTGRYLSQDVVREIVTLATDSLVVLDEAYIAFTEGAWDSSDLIGQGNVVILRSMTKDYALAGLRIGYMLSSPDIVSVIRKVLPPWNVNAVAQRAGLFSLEATSYLEECNIKIREAKQFLVRELTAMGLIVVPSDTNFFLVRVGEGCALRKALLKKKILVRDCASFGLLSCIR